MGIQDHLTYLLRNLYAGQEATVRTGHGTTDWFQIGKGVRQGYILSPCLFNLYAEYIMWNAGWMKYKLESRLLGEISITSDMQMTPPLWQKSEVTQSCPTLCDPKDCSLSGSSVHGIFQARILGWFAISFSRASFRPRDWTCVSRIAGRCFNIWAISDLESEDIILKHRAESITFFSKASKAWNAPQLSPRCSINSCSEMCLLL